MIWLVAMVVLCWRLPPGTKAYGLARQLGKRVLKFFLAAHGHPSKLKCKFMDIMD